MIFGIEGQFYDDAILDMKLLLRPFLACNIAAFGCTTTASSFRLALAVKQSPNLLHLEIGIRNLLHNYIANLKL